MITLPADEVNNALALGKHPAFLVRAAAPFNGGPPPDLQIREALTPTPLFFVRNHGNIPAIDPAAYRLRVGGRVARPLELSLDDLRALPQHTVVAALQCAGNRRQEMLRLRDIPGEVPWHLEAVGNAEWRGPALADLLRLAGVAPDAGHVALTGLDDVERRGAVFGFGGSIPLAKALGSEVILALEMNGEPLAPAHGAPLRLVVPGVIGARSVKWLGEITVQDEPSDNYFQAVAYRLLPPDAADGGDRPDVGRHLRQRGHRRAARRGAPAGRAGDTARLCAGRRRQRHQPRRTVRRRRPDVDDGRPAGREPPVGLAIVAGHAGTAPRPAHAGGSRLRRPRRLPAGGRGPDVERQGVHEQCLAPRDGGSCGFFLSYNVTFVTIAPGIS